MSSHHIIRDEQEPPVLVFQIFNNWEELSELLGWSPLLLIKPELQMQFDARQTKVDGYLLNQDKHILPGEKDLVYGPKNFATTLKHWVANKKYTGINLFCRSTFAEDLFAQIKDISISIPVVFFTDQGKYTMIPKSTFKKWYPKGHEIFIFNEDIKYVENLQEGKKEYFLSEDGFITIKVEGSFIFIKEK